MIPRTPVHYEVDLSGYRRNEIRVRMTLNLPGHEPVDVALPTLCPGSPTGHLIHPSKLRNVQVSDGSGKELRFEKLESGGWRINRLASGDPVTVSYVLTADEFNLSKNHLNEEHAALNGSATFMFVKGHEADLSSVVRFSNLPDPAWGSESTLSAVRGERHAYYSRSYHELADSSTEIGGFQKARRFVNDTEVVLTQHGKSPWTRLRVNEVTPEENLEDFSRLWNAFLAEFGRFPASRLKIGPRIPRSVERKDRYFINKHYITGQARATGLEHYHGHDLIFMPVHEIPIARFLNGSARVFERRIMAHELGHKLLAKYVQHDRIDSADYCNEQRTDGLWLTEGGTDWIGLTLERRAGLITADDYVKRVAKSINDYVSDYESNPTNARENSLDAQVKNGQYYNKGALLSAMLDLEIRHRTLGRKSFSDVLRKLKREFGGTGRTHTLRDIERVAEKVCGSSLGDFFNDYLRDRKPIDFNRHLAHVGYVLEPRTDAWDPERLALPGVILETDGEGKIQVAPGNGEKPGALPAYFPGLGVLFGPNKEGKWVVEDVRKDSLAFEGGLRPGTILEGLTACTAEGNRVNLLPAPSPGLSGPIEAVDLEFAFKQKNLFNGEEKRVEIRVPVRPRTRTVVKESDVVSSQQARVRQGWLKAYPEAVLVR